MDARRNAEVFYGIRGALASRIYTPPLVNEPYRRFYPPRGDIAVRYPRERASLVYESPRTKTLLSRDRKGKDGSIFTVLDGRKESGRTHSAASRLISDVGK